MLTIGKAFVLPTRPQAELAALVEKLATPHQGQPRPGRGGHRQGARDPDQGTELADQERDRDQADPVRVREAGDEVFPG